MRFYGSSTFFTFDDVLIVPKYSEVKSRKIVEVSSSINESTSLRVPLISANMDTVFSPKLAEALFSEGGIATLHQFMSVDLQVEILKKLLKKKINVIPTCGVTKDAQERYKKFIKAGANIVMFDTPHAHTSFTIDAVKKFKNDFPKITLIVGNVATGNGCESLARAGADVIKVGVGPGSACLTRERSGVGVPQLSAIIECAEVAKTYRKRIVADGGIKKAGDFVKAIAAGADFCMMGRIFTSTEESPGEVIVRDGKRFKEYRGSSSEESRKYRMENDPDYTSNPKDFVEGGKGLTEILGDVASVVKYFEDGLKSALSYVDARNLTEFQSKAQFIKVSPTTQKENGLHGMI